VLGHLRVAHGLVDADELQDGLLAGGELLGQLA
jgi:hypothetical protein